MAKKSNKRKCQNETVAVSTKKNPNDASEDDDLRKVLQALQRDQQNSSNRKKQPLLNESTECLIFSVSSVLSAKECKLLINYMENSKLLTRTFHEQTHEIAYRDNHRLLVRSSEFARILWARIQPFVPAVFEARQAMGLNPAIRFYRYSVGQRFGCHVDESDYDQQSGWHSRYTLLFYLNDTDDSDLDGGCTVFYHNQKQRRKGRQQTPSVALEVKPVTGMALIHGHGDRCLLHEGQLVTKGVKYLLRTDVMYA